MKKGFELWKTLAGIVILLVIIIGGWYIYSRSVSQSPAAVTAAQDRKAISSLVHGYYYSYYTAVNSNNGWNKIIANYTTSTASITVAANGQTLLNDAAKQEQYWISTSSPITVRLYSYSSNAAEVLADGTYSAGVVGYKSTQIPVEQMLSLAKINGRWYITGIFDRSARLNTYVNQYLNSYEQI